MSVERHMRKLGRWTLYATLAFLATGVVLFWLSRKIDIWRARAEARASIERPDIEGLKEILYKHPELVWHQYCHKHSYTLLHYSAQWNQPDIAEELLRRGAFVNARTDGDLTALYIAVNTSSVSVASTLLKFGADPNLGCGEIMPLHLAASNGNTKMVGLLLEAGALVNPRDSAGRTPMDCAHSAAVRDLLRKHGGTATRDF